MPGGILSIAVTDDFSVRMTGPVTKVAEGSLSEEIFDQSPLSSEDLSDGTIWNRSNF